MTPPEPDLEIQAAARLLADGSPGEAARLLERLVEAAPAYAAGLVLLARAYDGEGRPDEALDAWHRAHFLVPTSPLVRRERQLLLDARVSDTAATAEPTQRAGPPPLPVQDEAPQTDEQLLAEALLAEAAGTPSDPVGAAPPPPEEHADWAATEGEPFDALWVEEPEPDEAAPVDVSGAEADESFAPAFREDEAPIEDAPVIEVSGPEPAMDAFDWTVSPQGARPPVLPTPEETAGEPARLFAEDAFAGEVAFTAETVFAGAAAREQTEDDGAGEEGWTLLHETDERAPRAVEPQEADIAPPIGFSPSYWSVVPVPGSEDEPVDEAPEPTLRDSAGAPPAYDLDALIEQIESAPRIRPDPYFVAPAEPDEPPAEDEDVVSETLARIYAAQAQFAEAAAVYEKLALQRPESAVEFRRRAAELRERAGDQ